MAGLGKVDMGSCSCLFFVINGVFDIYKINVLIIYLYLIRNLYFFRNVFYDINYYLEKVVTSVFFIEEFT